MKRARGQALVEFLVAAALLVPLFVAIVLVGRLQDVRSHAQEAARYSAFAVALGSPPGAAVEREVRRRFFDEPGRRVAAADRTDPAEAAVNPHWRDLATAAPLLGAAADVAVQVANRPPPGVAAQALELAVSAADAAGRLTGGHLDVERAGFHDAEVRVRLTSTRTFESLGASAPQLRARVHVFGDDWSASGPAQTAERAEALVPATRLRQLRPLLDPIAWALSQMEPAFRQLCLGRVDAELVPADRLGAPGTGERGTWRARCY